MADRAYGAAPAGAWTRSTWTGRTGAQGRGPPVRSGCVRRDGRRAAVAPLAPPGARRGGGSGRGEASQGHRRGRHDEANAMTASPPRNDDGKEKLDGGGADFDENGGGAANLRLGVCARVLGGRGRLRRPINRWGRAGVLDPRAARKSEPAVPVRLRFGRR